VDSDNQGSDMRSDEKTLVSIGIPTYNRADSYLPQVLRSVLAQTYANIEVLVCDNCSSDNTQEIVKGFNDPRIRYFKHEKNIGANNNFNFALNQSRGAYFQLLHDDDLIDPDFVEVCMQRSGHRTDIGLIRTGLRRVHGDLSLKAEWRNRLLGPTTDDFIFSWFADLTPPYLCATLFHREGLREIGGFKSKHNLFQDVIAEFKLAHKMGKVDIEEPKASFREHSAEITFSVKINAWAEDALELLDVLCAIASEGGKDRVRSEGRKFFAKKMYEMIQKSAKEHGRERPSLKSYWEVYRIFKFRYLPPPVHRRLQKLYCWSKLKEKPLKRRPPK
jgi:glycosyltransferase involved in cell wall biosynthesis